MKADLKVWSGGPSGQFVYYCKDNYKYVRINQIKLNLNICFQCPKGKVDPISPSTSEGFGGSPTEAEESDSAAVFPAAPASPSKLAALVEPFVGGGGGLEPTTLVDVSTITGMLLTFTPFYF